MAQTDGRGAPSRFCRVGTFLASRVDAHIIMRPASDPSGGFAARANQAGDITRR